MNEYGIPERTKQSIAGLRSLCFFLDAELKKQSVMAEIGAWTGMATQIFAEYFTLVYAIDPWARGIEIAGEHDMKKVEEIFKKRTYRDPTIVPIKKRSLQAVSMFQDHYFDMVYIDALHAYEFVSADILVWKNKVKKGGYLCGHDYDSRFPGVIKAVDHLKAEVKLFPDTSWAVKLC